MSIKHFHNLSMKNQQLIRECGKVLIKEKIDGVPVELRYQGGRWVVRCPYYDDETQSPSSIMDITDFKHNDVYIPIQFTPSTSRHMLRDLCYHMVAGLIDCALLDPKVCNTYTFECLPFKQTNVIEYPEEKLGIHLISGDYNNIVHAVRQFVWIEMPNFPSIKGHFHRVTESVVNGATLDELNKLLKVRKDIEGIVIEVGNITCKLVTYHFRNTREDVWAWMNHIHDTSFNRNKQCLVSQYQRGSITKQQLVRGIKMYLSTHVIKTPVDAIHDAIVREMLEQYE